MASKKKQHLLTGLQIPSYFTRIRYHQSQPATCFSTNTSTSRILYMYSILYVLYVCSDGVLSEQLSPPSSFSGITHHNKAPSNSNHHRTSHDSAAENVESEYRIHDSAAGNVRYSNPAAQNVREHLLSSNDDHNDDYIILDHDYHQQRQHRPNSRDIINADKKSAMRRKRKRLSYERLVQYRRQKQDRYNRERNIGHGNDMHGYQSDQAQPGFENLESVSIPSQPASLSLRAISEDSIMAAWTAPADARTRINGYILGFGEGAPDEYRLRFHADQRVHTITGLRPGVGYVISLSAYNQAGEGRQRFESVTTLRESVEEADAPLTPPVGIKAKAISSSSIHLTWTDTSLGRNQQISDHRFYTVRYRPTSSSKRHQHLNVTDLIAWVENLQADTVYDFSVRLVKGRQRSTWSIHAQNKTFELEVSEAPFFNLATRADIVANATCGELRTETYCKLVEHVRDRIDEQIQCGTCDDKSHNGIRHSAYKAIDGSVDWWQSPTIANGKQFNYVTITLDLKQTYQVAYVIVKAANSPRPGNWILERSIDGVTFKPWQYFAVSSSTCLSEYNIEPYTGIPNITRDDQVLCTSQFSKLEPLRNGEIHISLVNGRPGSHEKSQLLKEFTTARYVRLRLQRIQTLYADLMTFVYNDPKDLDPSVTNRYFYSIKDISIGGQCICMNQDSKCIIDPVTGEGRCQCLANTCGNNCDQCCPLFNQKPWKPNNALSSPSTAENDVTSLCEECNCFNHAESCVYNQTVADNRLSMDIYGEYNGGGLCINCKDNTMGINCEICEDGYYRPSGVDPRSVQSCIACQCDYVGATGQCVKDDDSVVQEIYAGDCMCREGFCGPNCEDCAPGYTGYPYCVPCPCDPLGSVNMDLCEADCQCKSHVCGVFCDACLPGHFHLRPENPDGCTECFCFGLSSDCSSSTIPRDCLTGLSDWKVNDYVDSGCITPHMSEEGSLYVRTAEAKREGLNRAMYWEAPPEYKGNKVTSYDGVLEYVFSYVINVTNGDESSEEGYLGNYDVILQGNGIIIGYNGIYYAEDIVHHIAMNLTELGWKHMDDSTSARETQVTREELLTVLTNIERLLIRVSYHVDQIESRLHAISLDVSTSSGSGRPIPAVEMCVCPHGYAGTSCEQCAHGYRRVGNILLGGTCEPCTCNGHSSECDAQTGDCLNCKHNTAGPQCNRCSPGFSGDAHRGTADACQSCACPLDNPDNNFASDCVISERGATQCFCREGYEGTRCERCSLGFYGNPLEPGNFCKQCNCHGNSNPGHCEAESGRCKNCQGNTEGQFCERCTEGYYGTAEGGDCQVCACNTYGSDGSSCDAVTGQCLCRPYFTGTDCGQCVEGYGNLAAGCVECMCSPIGSEPGSSCDPITGQCECKPGVEGVNCDECGSGFFGFSMDGCTDCNCAREGSHGVECEESTGQCYCKTHVGGAQCQRCEAAYWGHSSGEGCMACMCDPVGAVTSQCDVNTGMCHCQPGITGATCNKCQPGFYGFSNSGCTRCPVCPRPNQVCDAVTGQCNCPPNTIRPLCEDCEPNHWGYSASEGCQACSCDPRGAVASQCGLSSGQCLCTELHAGLNCDQCEYGHYDFPGCSACDCDLAGTVYSDCDEQGVCMCQNNGQCHCKENAVGLQCKECAENAFSLQKSNTKGCTKCFCSGRTDRCQQAPYAWSLVHIPSSAVNVHYISADKKKGKVITPNRQNQLVVPANISTVSIFPENRDRPIYWTVPLDETDWTLSYNGMLSFKMTVPHESHDLMAAPDGRRTKLQPLVTLLGNYVMRLRYVNVVSEVVDVNSGQHQYYVKFIEDDWRTESGATASRDQLMVALQNIQSIIIKMADKTTQGYYSIEDVEVERAVPVASGETYNAFGIEQCDCPPQYVGLSCQDPAAGFYRVRPGSDNVSLVNPEPQDLIGYAHACLCNAHSEMCHPDTGVCSGCRDNTQGKHCELCVSGYYGDARGGTPYDCQLCDCPSLPGNDSPSCRLDTTSAHGLVCDECPPGYGGDICDTCASGYYSYSEQSECVPCGCNPKGAYDPAYCDPLTGQCECFQGILGRSCDQCAARHAVDDGSCVPCDVGCTGILFDEIDKLNTDLQLKNLSAAQFLPWKFMTDINDTVASLQKIDNVVVKEVPEDWEHVINNVTELQKWSDRVSMRAELLKSKGDMVIEDDVVVKEESEKLLKEVDENLGDLREYVQPIVESILGRLESGEFDLDEAIMEAEGILNATMAANHTMRSIEIDRERRLAESLLEKVKLYQQDHQLYMNSTVLDVADLIAKLTDLLQYTRRAEDVSGQAAGLDDTHTDQITNIQELMSLIEENHSAVLGTHSEGDEINKQAQGLLTNATRDHNEADNILQGLGFDIPAIEMKVGILERNVNTLRDAVTKAVNHSEKLNQQMEEFDGLFNDTRQTASDPLSAASSFIKMAEAINESEIAVKQAAEVANNASIVVLEGNNGTLSYEAATSKVISQSLDYRAENNKVNVSKLRDRLTDEEFSQQDTYDIHEETTKRFTRLKEQLNNITVAKTNASDVLTKAQDTVTSTNKSYVDITRMKNDIDNNMKRKLEELKGYQVQGISKANASVNAIRNEFRAIESLTMRLHDRAASINQIGNDIAYDLAQLRERIKLAREQANSIKVSLHHKDSCYRKYQPNLKSATTNSVRLHFKTDEPQNNMLLFMMATPGKPEYMALELVDAKVRFSWNSGGYTTVLTHPRLITTSDGVDEREAWFEVNAERIAHVGILSVKYMSSTRPAQEVRIVSKSPAQTTLNVVNTTAVYLGGAPSHIQLPGQVTSSPFSGCIGDVYIDKNPVGLYNFRELTGKGCSGCSAVPTLPVTDMGEYQFDGTGYSSNEQVLYNEKFYGILFQFKAIYGDSMLFFTQNEHTGDYLSIELRSGRVVFTYSFQGVSTGRIETVSQYNINQWVEVDVRKQGLEFSMKVGQEALTGSSPDVGIATMDLTTSTVYFGGVPETVKAYLHLYNISSLSFVGCMRQINIASKGTFTINLKEGLYLGLASSCSAEKSREVGLDGTGHLELPSQNLPPDAEITFSFRTQQENALLLLSLGTKTNVFYSVSVVGGRIAAWFNAGNGLQTIESDKMYNDGYYHTITVIKTNRLIELHIDDEPVGDTRLPPGDSRISSMREEGGGLYIGGVPAGVEATGSAASLQPLRGCLSHIILGQKLLTLDLPISYKKADVGRCNAGELFENITGTGDSKPNPGIPSFTVTVKRPEVSTTSAPPQPEPTLCATEGVFDTYEDVVTFGDVKHSHAKVIVKRKSLTKDFNITLDFRTFYSLGLLVYITNTLQTEYVAVEMIQGKVLVSYEGKNLGKALQSAVKLNDGNWHSLRVVKVERSITVRVDYDDPIVEKINRKLDVDAPVYVGGVPETLDPREGLISESFKGCVRNFALNGETVNLASSLEQVMGIRRCYKYEQRGAHFDGYGYAIFAERYEIKSEFTFEAEFRTTKQDGIILSISSAKDVALTLEMYKGELRLTAINKGGQFRASSDVCEFCLCDNRWHTIKADLIKNIVTLEVDGRTTHGISEGYERYLNTDSSLYIGGYPSYAEIQAAASTEEFFVGCLKDIKLNGEEISYHKMYSLIDVHVSGCPLSLL